MGLNRQPKTKAAVRLKSSEDWHSWAGDPRLARFCPAVGACPAFQGASAKWYNTEKRTIERL